MKNSLSLSATSSSFRIGNARMKREGAALIITLSILVLLSIVIVGMATTTRTERSASSSHLERFRAELMAQEATESVIALFNSETINPLGYWATQPGVLITSPASSSSSSSSSSAASNRLETKIHLSSMPSTLAGSSTTKTASDNPAILNIKKLLAPVGTISDRVVYNPAAAYNPATDGMKLNWVYVHQDGSCEWSEAEAKPDTSDAVNPVIGRYAYWVDDENCKININTAHSRAAQANLSIDQRAPIGDPANVSLEALKDENDTSLTTEMANSLKTERTTNGLFNSPEEAKRIADTQTAGALQASKFDVTHYGNAPNMTFFNKPQIVLTTQKAYLNPSNLESIEIQEDNTGDGIPYLDILTNPNTDPWDVTNISATKIAKVISKLNEYLSTEKWPFVSGGSSFQDKYYAGVPARLTQLSLNIIEYVRSKETDQPWVIPIRGTINTSTGAFTLVNNSTPSGTDGIMGMPRTPRINEFGVFLSGTTAKLYLEIHLPKYFGFDDIEEGIDLNGFTVYGRFIPEKDGVQGDARGGGTTPPELGYISTATTKDEQGNPSTKLKPGGYLVFSAIIRDSPTGGTTFKMKDNSRPTGFAGRVAIATPKSVIPGGVNRRLDIVALNGLIRGKIDDVSVSENNISSVEIADPRVSAHGEDWEQSAGADGKLNTFGKRNSRYFDESIRVASSEPQQDTVDGTRNGAFSDDSLVMPSPKNSAKNREGKISSVGELGFVHTGMRSSAAKGTPWRTLRLQPSDAGNNEVPDWALLDLFAVPPSTSNATSEDERKRLQELYNPHNATASAGKININTAIEPFTSLERQASLKALLVNAPKDYSDPDAILSNAEAENIAEHIYNFDYSPNEGTPFGTLQNIYDSPGEVVEITGVADTGEKSEELVRQILGLVTTRSNVFTVYAIGQALKQDANGNLTVTAEERTQSMIERYSTLVTDIAANTEVKYRTVYNRSLTP